MRRRHSQTQQTDGLGEGSRSASAREGFTGTGQASLDATTMRQGEAPRLGESEVVVEVRLTDFGGCRLNAAQVGTELANQSWRKDPVQKFRALLGRSLTTGLWCWEPGTGGRGGARNEGCGPRDEAGRWTVHSC